MMEIQQYMQTLGQQARQASRAMARATTGIKNQALLNIAAHIEASREILKLANASDM
ncbi:MAG: glutamate-5-semialdehyde dehydrogenase, partial [Oleispira sp.]